MMLSIYSYDIIVVLFVPVIQCDEIHTARLARQVENITAKPYSLMQLNTSDASTT
jgi:hypothetical protein